MEAPSPIEALNEVQKTTFSLKIGGMFSVKDPISCELRASVVYKFLCAGCNACYIGETNQHFSTRVPENLYRIPNTWPIPWCVSNIHYGMGGVLAVVHPTPTGEWRFSSMRHYAPLGVSPNPTMMGMKADHRTGNQAVCSVRREKSRPKRIHPPFVKKEVRTVRYRLRRWLTTVNESAIPLFYFWHLIQVDKLRQIATNKADTWSAQSRTITRSFEPHWKRLSVIQRYSSSLGLCLWFRCPVYFYLINVNV